MPFDSKDPEYCLSLVMVAQILLHHYIYGILFYQANNDYCRYEREGRGRRTVPARKLWDHIISAQIETGTPFMLYKDSCNRKSNQQNLGTIACSNLCTEIIEYCAADEVCPVLHSVFNFVSFPELDVYCVGCLLN